MITLAFMRSDLESPWKLVRGDFHSLSQISAQILNYAGRTMSSNNFQEECLQGEWDSYIIFFTYALSLGSK